MAGSKRWQVYTSDNGETYRVLLDESNGVAGGFTNYAAADGSLDKPSGLEMRYVNVEHPSNGSRRRIPVATNDSDLWTGAEDTVTLPDFNVTAATATAYVVRSWIGERRTGNPIAADTGLTGP